MGGEEGGPLQSRLLCGGHERRRWATWEECFWGNDVGFGSGGGCCGVGVLVSV